MAINPGEEAKMQMFIWNNIFFSLGFDVRDHYKVSQAMIVVMVVTTLMDGDKDWWMIMIMAKMILNDSTNEESLKQKLLAIENYDRVLLIVMIH